MPEQQILHQRYRVDGLIGRGGMADVFLGVDLVLNRTVAVKMMRPDLARDPQFQARFRQEARSSAALNHPAIVAVYDTGSVKTQDGHHEPVDCPYLVMEHVDGHTLRELLQEGEVTWEQAVRWTRGLLEALEHSHEHGIVHRDVKPANVMVTRAGTIKVMDFGIARALSDTSAQTAQTQAVVGTALYLPPEQAQGLPLDARSDLYAAGCVLFELLTGRPPFLGETPLAIAYQHVREEPPAPSEVDPSLPPAFDAVVLRALRKDPEGRHPSARALLTALDAAAADPFAAPAPRPEDAPTGPLPRVVPTAGSSAVGSATGAVAAAASVGAAAAAGTGADRGTSATAREELIATTPVPARPSAEQRPPAGDDETGDPLSPGHAVAGAAAPGAPSAAQLAAAAAVAARDPATGQIPTLPAAVVPVDGRGANAIPRGLDAAPHTEEAVSPVVSHAAPEAGGAVHRSRRTLLAVLAGLLGLMTVAIILLLSVDRGDHDVRVPDVVGLAQADADRAITAAGLTPGLVTNSKSSGVPGTVLATDPGAGAALAPGRDVRLTVAQDPAALTLPLSLRGEPEAAVRQALEALDLTIAAVEYRASGELAQGELVETEPALGTRVSAGDSVVLHLSDGTVTLPDVVGMSGPDARRTLRSAAPELTLRFLAPADQSAESGTVVMQDPPAGTRVPNDSTLTLTTSDAVEATAVASAEPASEEASVLTRDPHRSGGGLSESGTTHGSAAPGSSDGGAQGSGTGPAISEPTPSGAPTPAEPTPVASATSDGPGPGTSATRGPADPSGSGSTPSGVDPTGGGPGEPGAGPGNTGPSPLDPPSSLPPRDPPVPSLDPTPST